MSDEEFKLIVNNSKTMAEAFRKTQEIYPTFKKFANKAKKLGVYNPNPGGKGTNKIAKTYFGKEPCKLQDILEGKHPQYQSRKLKIRLIDEGILEDKCYKCRWAEKRLNAKYTTCELHHKDGNSHNHLLKNLQILCPNCHSLTENFRFNNKSHKNKKVDN